MFPKSRSVFFYQEKPLRECPRSLKAWGKSWKCNIWKSEDTGLFSSLYATVCGNECGKFDATATQMQWEGSQGQENFKPCSKSGRDWQIMVKAWGPYLMPRTPKEGERSERVPPRE